MEHRMWPRVLDNKWVSYAGLALVFALGPVVACADAVGIVDVPDPMADRKPAVHEPAVFPEPTTTAPVTLFTATTISP